MLTFCNSHSTAIATAISFLDEEECGLEGNGWKNIGWYWVEPGTCRVVYQNDVDDANRYWYFYAKATDGTVWEGEYNTYVKHEAFDHCDNPPDSTMFLLGFRELDVGDAEDCTLTFVT